MARKKQTAHKSKRKGKQPQEAWPQWVWQVHGPAPVCQVEDSEDEVTKDISSMKVSKLPVVNSPHTLDTMAHVAMPCTDQCCYTTAEVDPFWSSLQITLLNRSKLEVGTKLGLSYKLERSWKLELSWKLGTMLQFKTKL